jgi:hypothetical protein
MIPEAPIAAGVGRPPPSGGGPGRAWVPHVWRPIGQAAQEYMERAAIGETRGPPLRFTRGRMEGCPVYLR